MQNPVLNFKAGWTNKLKGVITPHVMDEVLFKILIAEASQHIEKFTLPGLKKEMKSSGFSSKVYKPVREYSDYLTELTYGGLEILTVDGGLVEKSTDLGLRYGLLTTDAIHLSTMKQYGIINVATNDSDFERVESITIYKPERSTA
ncbi:tRNA(fMet)-specific endonuclease VapC [uncultured archaeon]|nr:tRNA(fMet)-specific endonuclease VapC [uncultured archaeon]